MTATVEFSLAGNGAQSDAPAGLAREARGAGGRVEKQLRRLLGPGRALVGLEQRDPGTTRVTVTLDASACEDLATVLEAISQRRARKRLRWRRSRRGRRALTKPPGPGDLERELVVAVAERFLATTLAAIETVDAAEHEDPDPATLALLYDVDWRLAQVRRGCEKLLAICDFPTPASEPRAMSLLNVCRAAVGECHGFRAVTVTPIPRGWIRPGASDGIAHIIAELIDNAVSVSAGRRVSLSAARADNKGPVFFEVADDGPAVTPERLVMLNSRVTHEPRLDADVTRHMGLYAAAKLARGLNVSLAFTARPGGGITAHVEVPPELVLDDVPTAAPGGAVAFSSGAARVGSARADRWEPDAPAPSPGQITAAGLPKRARPPAAWAPGSGRPALRRPSPDAVDDAAALDKILGAADASRSLRADPVQGSAR